MNQSRIINDYFSRLSNIVDNKTWTHYATNAAKLEEKAMKGNSSRSPKEAGRLQVLNFTFCGLTYKPEPKDFLDTREGCMMAYAIADKYGDEIRKEFTQDEINTIFEIWKG